MKYVKTWQYTFVLGTALGHIGQWGGGGTALGHIAPCGGVLH